MPKNTRHWARLVWKKCPVSRIHVLKAEKATTNYAGKMQQKYQNKGYKKHEYMQGIGLHFMTIFLCKWKMKSIPS